MNKLKLVRNLPALAMIAIIAVSAVVVIAAIAYVVGNASDAKFMFLVAVLAVGFGSGFGALTLGFLVGYVQESPATQERFRNLHAEIERLKKVNTNLKKALADFASDDQAGIGVTAAPRAQPAAVAVEPSADDFERPLPPAEPPKVVISLTPFLTSLKLGSLRQLGRRESES